MILKLNNVINLQQVYDKLKAQPLSFTTKYKLLKLFNSVQVEADFYKTQLTELIETYGMHDENGELVKTDSGDGIKIVPENIDIFQQKYIDLLGLEVSLPDITFELSEFEKVDLPLEDLEYLFPFIKDN